MNFVSVSVRAIKPRPNEPRAILTWCVERYKLSNRDSDGKYHPTTKVRFGKAKYFTDHRGAKEYALWLEDLYSVCGLGVVSGAV